MIDLFNSALLMRQNVFESLRDSTDGLRKALQVVLLVGLLVGGINGIRYMLDFAQPEHMFDQYRLAIQESIDQRLLSVTDPTERQMILAWRNLSDQGVVLALRIMGAPTTAPRPVTGFAQGLGVMATQIAALFSWVIISGLIVHVVARRMGGTGTVQQMLALTALATAPHALDALAFIPQLGAMLSPLGWAWGFAIFVIGTSVAHRITLNQAIAATIFFPALIIGLALFSCCAFSTFVTFVQMSAA